MKVIINPYHKSVTIDGVEVVQKFINFPDALNHLASISCDYDRDSQTITDVQDVHRYVSHAIEKQYYYKHLPEFVDWFYAEQQAQLDNAISVEQQIVAANTAAQNAATSAEKAKLEAEEAKKTNQNTQQAVDNAVAKLTQAGSTLPVKSDGTDIARTLGERFADVVNVKDFGAVGDGQTDDTEAIQAALNTSENKTVWIPSGQYRLSHGVIIPSYCHVFGDGAGKTIILFDSAAEFTAAFIAECGTDQIEIENIELRGPYYRVNGDYTSYPIQSIRMNNGISIRGRYYQQRQNLTREGTSHNINIHHLKIEGFGYAGVHADQIDVCRVNCNDISWCGCFGIRFLGCVDHWAEENIVHDLGPGDPDNRNSNRVYGITTNRVYGNTTTDILPGGTVNPEITTIYRRAENAWFCRNRVYNCKTWKGLDTHGGKNINFIDNHVTDCHIGIGIDMAGYLECHGYVRVEDIKITGNTVERYLPDQSDEGNAIEDERYACAAAGINVGAKDESYDGNASADLFGYNLIISGNNLVGWGEKGRNVGAITVYNWKNVLIEGNVIRNSRTAAIVLDQIVQSCRVTNNIIRDVRSSDIAYGSVMTRGIAVAKATVEVSIDGNLIWNTQNNALNAVSISNNGLCRLGENTYINSGTGSLVKVERPNYLTSICPIVFTPIAQGLITVSTDEVTYNGFGIESTELQSDGIAVITLNDKVYFRDATIVTLTRRGSSLGSMGYDSAVVDVSGNKTKIIVYLRDSSGATTIGQFYLSVFGFVNEV